MTVDGLPEGTPWRRPVALAARWRQRLIGLSGWRRAAHAWGLGVLSVLALPPLYIVIVLPIALTGLYWMAQAAPSRRTAFAVGWWFGFGHFTAGLYWIAFALLVEAGQYGWMVPFAVFGLSAYFAFFPALAVLAVRLAGGRGIGGVLLFAVAWTAAEWLRGWLLTGFPWNPIGSVWAVSDAMIQVSAVIGVYGLGMVTVATLTMPALLVVGGRRVGWALGLCVALLAAIWGGGTLRLATVEPAVVDGVRLRLVQPNIPQKLKWQKDLRLGHVEHQLNLSQRPPSGAPPTHIIWAETAVPFFLDREPFLRQALARATPRGGLTITGTLRTTPERSEPFRVWNSLQAIDRKADVVGTYDKVHLVPFGEYVPLRSWLPVTKVTAGRGDFAAGSGLKTVHWPGLPPAGPLICYEVIFPGHVTDRDNRPDWLLNVTNDAWYGRTSGPFQHLVATRFRAVEEGLPVVRVANTGISAVIDSYGRIVASLGLQKEGVVDSDLPTALSGLTPFARLGDGIILILVGFFGSLGFAMSRADTSYVV